MVNLQNIKVKADNSFQTVCPFPIGFVYSSMNSTSPASTFGGSWTEIKGRFPYFNAGTGTGGSMSHTHTLDDAWACVEVGAGSIGVHHKEVPVTWNTNKHILGNSYNSGWESSYGAVLGGTTSSGGSLPPYQTLYAWYRTA